MLPVAVGFALVYLVAGIVFSRGALVGAAGIVSLFAISVVMARRAVRTDVARAAEIVAAGLFCMCLAGAPLLPWLRSALLLIPLAGIALVLPDLAGRRLRRLLLLAFLAEALTVAVSTWVPPLFVPPPEWLRSLVIVTACTISIGLTVLLLWDDANRLRRSIAAADFHALAVQAVVERAPIVIFALDSQGRFTLSEGQGLSALGLAPGEVVGRSVFSLYEHLTWLLPAIRSAMDGTENAVTGSFGDRVLEVHLRPLEGGGAIGVSADVTERHRASEELQRAVRVRDEFLTVASHELKTPLTPLRLETTAMERAAAKGDLVRLRERASKLHRHVERLDALVEQLLDVGRIRAGHVVLEREKADLEEIVSTVAARMESEVERAGCKLAIRREGDARGDWDASRIDQVVTNLLSNALKYGPGEPIDVELRGEGNHVLLEVRDRGLGIDAADHARIFQRFERAVSERNYGGFGVGLFIVHELVTAHGGTIAVRSALGEGATFIVTLPRQVGSAQQRKPVE
jgi:signal transduction histidine kinase